MSISTQSSLYQIFSKAIFHPFTSKFSLFISISFITAIFRIFFLYLLLELFNQILVFSCKGEYCGFFGVVCIVLFFQFSFIF